MEKGAKKKRIYYEEGQWFAVPLRDGGYALGIIVRGSYRTKGGLGYFFGPRYERIPDEYETWQKQPSQAVLIAWFGDLGIITGRWPLISSSRPFHREEWPVPKFSSIDAGNPSMGWIVEYRQDAQGWELPMRRTYCPVNHLIGLPQDGVYGYEAIEILLTKLLGMKHD